jgi:hypothetical protein
MTATPDLRTKERVKHKARILLDNYLTDCCYEARMINYSSGGMYFESDYAPLPGSQVSIGIGRSPYHTGADIYRAQVRWRKTLPQNSKYAYGVGVRYEQPVND